MCGGRGGDGTLLLMLIEPVDLQPAFRPREPTSCFERGSLRPRGGSTGVDEKNVALSSFDLLLEPETIAMKPRRRPEDFLGRNCESSSC